MLISAEAGLVDKNKSKKAKRKLNRIRADFKIISIRSYGDVESQGLNILFSIIFDGAFESFGERNFCPPSYGFFKFLA